MPSPTQLLADYKVTNGNTYANYKITNVNITEHSIVRYNEYAFDIDVTLTWQGAGAPSMEAANEMLKAFFATVVRDRIVLSDSGRPYQCTFTKKGMQPEIKQENNYQTVHYITQAYAQRVSGALAAVVTREGKWQDK
jgi:hypothetical protein